ncbi:DDB1- and CUL4-associated factor 10 homolog [Teleopsis dalmanni]|uniref:DDB1- and CUL4-associated factor 10 homolog n=1 Tax=Teleopsis dalmanni TaxID=139649 RepID=UPI0018CCF092|nr:DDB1- and CUL4-associated factor 10 homolog [Teleopsis dalmanni]
MSYLNWLTRRESALPPRFNDTNSIMKRIYSSVEPYQEWKNEFGEFNKSEFGGVFNLEFSPEGNIVVAACEKKCVLLFDAVTTNHTHKIMEAHTDRVNCVKFLNNRMFATCSDDTTVALWDIRQLKRKVRSLHGHSNWVKNIEYSTKDNLLVTSGFDGSIFTWDINALTEQGLIYQKVFHTSGLMRCRITPDGTKLVICTTGGFLMIVHELDLTTLHKDLCGFRPLIYRLMQMGNQYIPQAAKFEHVFSKKQKKNRVELVTDFPDEDDAEVILALQIDPQGQSLLSRNICHDENSEWSCVHDINEEPFDITDQVQECGQRKRKLGSEADDERSEEETSDSPDDVHFNFNRRRRLRSATSPRVVSPPPPPPTSSNVLVPQNRSELFVPDIWAAEVTVQERAMRQTRSRSSSSVTGYSFVYAISSGVLPATVNRTANSSNNPEIINRRYVANSSSEESRLRPGSPNILSPPSGLVFVPREPPTEHRPIHLTPMRTKERNIVQNAKKLMYYIPESNKGKGFIKEPSFSSDGRIISSPYENGVRLLGFSDQCSEYPRNNRLQTVKPEPIPLVVIKNISAHSDVVLSTKFSPREPLLVSGCLSGKVVWYHPNL